MWDPFDELSSEQKTVLSEFARLVANANKRVNLVSRGSLSAFHTAHIRHSLALAANRFPPGSTVVDWGTGGGLPGIPLAVRFPDAQFVLVDSIGKKTDLVRAMVLTLGLDNVEVVQSRAEEWTGRCDYAVSRATAPLSELWGWTERVLQPDSPADKSAWDPGLIALKGGDLDAEIGELRKRYPRIQVSTIQIAELMEGPFQGKYVVEVVGGR